MTDPFLGEIRMFGFAQPPTGWAFCNGQLLPLSQNTALFSLLGTFYGGDGKSTFALPNLNDRTPIGAGGPTGVTSERNVGDEGGTQFITLLESEIPSHTHQLQALDVTGDTPVPAAHVPARYPGAYGPAASLTAMSPYALAPTGGDLPHNNMQPFLTLNFCISLQGTFPPRP